MPWQTPKTNWTRLPSVNGRAAGDWFQFSDYMRIKGNLEYLARRVNVSLESMVAVDGYTVELPIAETINGIEHNLDILYAALSPLGWTPDPSKDWVSESYPPGVDDWNRWERACEKLLNSMSHVVIMKLPFPMGGRRF